MWNALGKPYSFSWTDELNCFVYVNIVKEYACTNVNNSLNQCTKKIINNKSITSATVLWHTDWGRKKQSAFKSREHATNAIHLLYFNCQKYISLLVSPIFHRSYMRDGGFYG